MGDVLNMLSFSQRKGQESCDKNEDGDRDTIFIERLPTGEFAFALNGAFTGSRRLTAQGLTKVLDRVLDD